MNGKLQIVGAIVKLDRPFRPPHIIDITALSRELVYYHLREMTKEGLLEKTGRVYQVKDKGSLLDSLVELAERTDTRKLDYSGTFFSKDTAERINLLAESIVCAKVLGEDRLAPEVREALIKKIDRSITELKNLRKFLNSAQRTENSAANKLTAQPLDETYDNWITWTGVVPSIGKKEWVDSIKEAVDEL